MVFADDKIEKNAVFNKKTVFPLTKPTMVKFIGSENNTYM